jgi:hypothetical protein
LAGWDIQAHRTLVANPDAADLVRVSRIQALIASATAVVSEAAASQGIVDSQVLEGIMSRLQKGRPVASPAAWWSPTGFPGQPASWPTNGAGRSCGSEASMTAVPRLTAAGVERLREQLSPRDWAVLRDVDPCRVMSGRQLQLLHVGDGETAARAARRLLARLTLGDGPVYVSVDIMSLTPPTLLALARPRPAD